MAHATVLPVAQSYDGPFTPLSIAVAGFLARYPEITRRTYRVALRQWIDWCAAHGLDPIRDVQRPHIELYTRHLEEERHLSPGTVAGKIGTLVVFYRVLVIDDMIPKSPAEYARRPRVPWKARTKSLTGPQIAALMTAADAHVMDGAIVTLLCTLGLRIAELCSLNVESVSTDRGHRTISFVGKGSKPATIPLPPRTATAVDRAIGIRTSGPLLLNRWGNRITRANVRDLLERYERQLGMPMHLHPHLMRHSAATALIKSGTPIRQIQLFMRHESSRTTESYLHDVNNLDAHASYALAQYIAGCV